jgi:ferredoxin
MYPGWFEPYTIVAKNLSSSLRNATEFFLYKAGIVELPEYVEISLFPVLLAGIVLLTILLLCFYKPRFFCNVLCPAGTILGVLARKGRIVPVINDSCVKCAKCMATCPAGCIDISKGTIDYELCVGCSNCIASCKLNAVLWSKYEEPISLALPTNETAKDNSRRDFLATFAAGAVSGAVLATGLKKHQIKKMPVMPPGAGTFERFTSQCTACGLCIANCDGETLKPALFEYGPGGMGQPMLSVKNGYCNYNCTKCMDVCPAGALIKLPIEQKRRLQLGRVTYFESRCVVVTDKTSCGACAEHCPVEALEMVPYGKDGLTIPKANPDICLGCGACEYICPVKPLPAVKVSGLSPQVAIKIDSNDDKNAPNAIPALKDKNSVSSKGKEEPAEEFPF